MKQCILLVIDLKALEDKDKQLDSLKKQLEISADEMAELTNQLEDLKKDATQGGGKKLSFLLKYVTYNHA